MEEEVRRLIVERKNGGSLPVEHGDNPVEHR
jgi:hypothetical protein